MTLWPFRRRPLHPRLRWPLDRPLLDWAAGEPFTLDDATKGVQVWGMTGSGKTSGSGRTLAKQYLRHGFGGLVLCAKPGEAQAWTEYAKITGRAADLVVFSPSAPWRFNFLNYELTRPGAGAGLTENLVALFAAVADLAGRGAGGGSGRDDDGYWRRSLQQLLRNAIDLLVVATGRVSVPDLYRLVVSAPTAPDQPADPGWRGRSFCWQCLARGEDAAKPGYRSHDFQVAADYWLLEFPALSDKTRSVIVSTFTSMADVLNRGVLRELFCTETTVTPDDCLAGKVVVVDLPVKEYADVGLFAAAVWKHQFQRAVERRPAADPDPRPVFLYADEAHLFTGPTDALFQTTARSARCCTVYLTQTLNNYLAAYTGPAGRADALSLLGNLTTHVVHCLGDSDTATFVADLIGRSRQLFMSQSSAGQPYDPIDDLLGRPTAQATAGFGEQLDFEVQPADLMRQKCGGAPAYTVGGLVWRGGRPFGSTGRPYLWTAFDQRR